MNRDSSSSLQKYKKTKLNLQAIASDANKLTTFTYATQNIDFRVNAELYKL